MSKLRCRLSISLDGFVAGPNQSEENPLGEGGGPNMFGPARSAVAPGATSSGRAGGAMTLPTITPCSSSPITRVTPQRDCSANWSSTSQTGRRARSDR